MSKLVSNYTSNGSSTTDEYGTFIALHRFLQGDVIQGFTVVAAASPNMTVLVQPGSGRITTGTSPADYGYFIAHDTSAGESVTIATAASSPRIDYIVAYIDKSVAGSTAAGNVNNTNNVLKFAAVAGTPAGSPVVPTTAQIQAAIGAANPYIILAQIAVAASVSQITNTNITDKRNMVGPVLPSDYVTPAKMLGIDLFAAMGSVSGTPPAAGTGQFYLQAGNTTITTAPATITFPVPFPNGLLVGFAQDSDGNVGMGLVYASSDKTGLRVTPTTSGTRKVNYWAIGF